VEDRDALDASVNERDGVLCTFCFIYNQDSICNMSLNSLYS